MTTQGSQSFHWRYDELDDRNFQIHGRTLYFIVVLFSVVILITLMFILVRWIYRLSSSSAAFADTVILSPRRQPSSRTHGLDSSVIDSLPITLHHPSSGETECCICLGVFDEGEKMKILPNCFHAYHCECVDKWLSTHSTCPICRAAIVVDSPV